MGWPGPMTHLQFLVWCEWLRTEQNNPGRIEHQIMRVEHAVWHHRSKSPPRIIDFDKYRVKYTFPSGRSTPPREGMRPNVFGTGYYDPAEVESMKRRDEGV